MSFAATCPPPPPLVSLVRLPGTGEPKFPVNGIVMADYYGTATELAAPGLVIRDAAHNVVPSTMTELDLPGPHRHLFLLVPNQPLAPSTKYDLADTVDWNCTAEPCTIALRDTTLFTTTTTSETVAGPPPAATLAAQAMDTCTGSACACGTYHALVTTLDNPATGALRFDLYDNGALVRRWAPFVISTDCAQPGDVPYPGAPTTVALAPGKHHLTWHGFDFANNESIGTQALDVDLECPAVAPPDANMGSGSGVDAGMPADDHGGGGCSASGRSTGALFALAMLAVVRRRRRR